MMERHTPAARIRDLGDLGSGFSAGIAINSLGHVAGVGSTATGQHGFFWSEQAGMVDLGAAGPDGYDAVTDINDLDVITGYHVTADGSRTTAFIWVPRSGFINLGTLGGASSAAQAINNRGEVVGTLTAPDGITHGFTWTMRNGMHDIGALQASDVNAPATIVGNDGEGALIRFANGTEDRLLGGRAEALNASDAVAGFTVDSRGVQRPAFWSGPTASFDSSGYADDVFSSAFGINNQGVVVGWGLTASATPHNPVYAFIWQPGSGSISHLPGLAPGAESDARAINARGQVTGGSALGAAGTPGSAVVHAYLLQPEAGSPTRRTHAQPVIVTTSPSRMASATSEHAVVSLRATPDRTTLLNLVRTRGRAWSPLQQ